MRWKSARPLPTACPQGPACRPLSRPPPHKPTHKGPRSHPHVTRMQMCCAVAGEIGLTQARGPACQQGSGSIRSRTWGAWESADHWAWCSEGRQEGCSGQQRQDAASQAAIPKPTHSSRPVPSQAQEPGNPLLLAAPPRWAARGLPLPGSPHRERARGPGDRSRTGAHTHVWRKGTEERKTDAWKLQQRKQG